MEIKKYIIKLTCWEYGNPTPYTEYIADANDKPMEFNTKDSAMVCLLQCAMEEANDLNFTPNEDGTFGTANGKQFIPDLNADHDCIIRAWDGEDYMSVTAYDVVEFSDECLGTHEDKTIDSNPCEYCKVNCNENELEHFNKLLQEKHGEGITVEIKSYTEDDGSTEYYYTSAKYGDSDSFNSPEEAYKAVDIYLNGVGEL